MKFQVAEILIPKAQRKTAWKGAWAGDNEICILYICNPHYPLLEADLIGTALQVSMVSTELYENDLLREVSGRVLGQHNFQNVAVKKRFLAEAIRSLPCEGMYEKFLNYGTWSGRLLTLLGGQLSCASLSPIPFPCFLGVGKSLVKQGQRMPAESH